MESILLQLIGKLGIELALLTLKNLQGVTTIEQAIARLEFIMTSQEYVNADAIRRGVPVRPLPTGA